MSTIHDLMDMLGAPPATVEVDQPYFVKYNPTTLKIIRVFSGLRPSETNVLQIDSSVGKKLVSGSENRSSWIIGFKGDVPELQKLDEVESFYRARNTLSGIVKLELTSAEDFYKVEEAASYRKALLKRQHEQNKARMAALISRTQQPSFMPLDYWGDLAKKQRIEEAYADDDINVLFDVILTVNKGDDTVEIAYDGDVVKKHEKLLRFFFTREDDPTYLKCVINLTNDGLNNIAKENGLDQWPNPVRVKIPYGVDDLSIFTVRSELEILVLGGK